MNTAGLMKYAGALVALAICSACGGALRQTQDGMAVAPPGAGLSAGYTGYIGKTLVVNGRPVTAARMNLGVQPRFASLVPHRLSRKKFEYVINIYGSYASIFDWPKSDQQIGTLNGAGGQGCTNVLYGYGNDIFWNVAGPSQITEYEVPQKPLKTLTVTYSFPSSCAMNSSGDLAVGILYGTSTLNSGGQVVIFKNASGSPKVYTTPLDEEFFDGYDSQGNLFADGFTGARSGFALVELAKGSSKFKTITTSNAIQFPGSVQWDGKYVTVVDQMADALYRYTVSGTKATLKGTVKLTGAGDCAQTWIATGVVYCGDAGGAGEVYKYPAGGSPIAVLTGNFDEPLGMVAARRR